MAKRTAPILDLLQAANDRAERDPTTPQLLKTWLVQMLAAVESAAGVDEVESESETDRGPES